MPNQIKGKNTGKKISIIRDELDIKGAGLYAFMPWTSLDKNKKAVIKIGESSDLTRRTDNYHTYFPNGVYMLGFITDIKIPKGTRQKPAKKPRVIREEMEQYIMDYINENGGKRLYSTSRVKRQNNTMEGQTEWVYTSIELLHEAFEKCAKKFNGKSHLYYLEGLNPETGKLEDITDVKEPKPNYTGKVILKI
jgi:hypothetical protein